MSGAFEGIDENEIDSFKDEETSKHFRNCKDCKCELWSRSETGVLEDDSSANSITFKGELPEAQDYKVYDYAQQEIERIRDRRESDFIPLTDEDSSSQEKFLLPLYCITGFFAAVMIIGPFLVKQGPNRGIAQASILLTAFCMWIFWFTIYFGQMNPLMGPRLQNTTLAWIEYKLGKPFASLVPAPEPEPEPEI